MAKMHTPAMEAIEKRNAKRKKPVKSTPAYESWKRFKRNPTALIGLAVVCLLILVAIFAPLIAPYDYQVQDFMAMMQKPSAAHLFGTDQFGRDIFSRCIYGARYSLIIALFCTIAAFFSGGLLGIIAGYFGGKVDTVIMRIMDIFQAIPMIMMAMCIVAVLGNGIPQLVAAIMFASMPTMARNNRGGHPEGPGQRLYRIFRSNWSKPVPDDCKTYDSKRSGCYDHLLRRLSGCINYDDVFHELYRRRPCGAHTRMGTDLKRR